MSNLIEQLKTTLANGDFATFDKLVVGVDDKTAVKISQMAYTAGHTAGMQMVVLQHPQRNYSLLFKDIVTTCDNKLGLWLLEHAPNTTVGTMERHTNRDLRNQVNEPLYSAIIERQAKSLEPRFLMESACNNRRIDFAQRAVKELEKFPIHPDHQMQSYELKFIEHLLSFHNLTLVEDFCARFPSRNVIHNIAVTICDMYYGDNFVSILKEVLDRYTPTQQQTDELNDKIHLFVEYSGYDTSVLRCLMTHYNPYYKDGEGLYSAAYLNDLDDFLMFLDATPLDVQKMVLERFNGQTGIYPPDHLSVLQSRILDLETQLQLQEIVRPIENESVHKKRMM